MDLRKSVQYSNKHLKKKTVEEVSKGNTILYNHSQREGLRTKEQTDLDKMNVPTGD